MVGRKQTGERGNDPGRTQVRMNRRVRASFCGSADAHPMEQPQHIAESSRLPPLTFEDRSRQRNGENAYHVHHCRNLAAPYSS